MQRLTNPTRDTTQEQEQEWAEQREQDRKRSRSWIGSRSRIRSGVPKSSILALELLPKYFHPSHDIVVQIRQPLP